MPETDPLVIPVALEAAQLRKDADDVARLVEKITEDEHTVDIEADTRRALSDLSDVEDAADDVDKLDPEVEVGADTTRAVKGLDDVKRSASDAQGTVGTLRDLGGPLDEAFGGLSGTAGDFGDAFAIAGEKIGSTIGLSEEAVGKLATSMGVGGVALGVVLTFWKMYQQGAEDARKRTEELMKTQEQLAQGHAAEVASKIVKDLGLNTLDAAKAVGLSTDQVIDFVTGTTDSIEPLNARLAELKKIYADTLAVAGTAGVPKGLDDQTKALEGTVNKLNDYRDGWIKANGTLQETRQAEFEVAQALNASTDEMLDQASTVSGPVRDSILRHIALVNGIPTDKLTTILTDTDPDDIAQVKAELDQLTKSRTVPVKFSVDVNAGDIAAQVRSAVALAGGSVSSSVQTYQQRNGPIS